MSSWVIPDLDLADLSLWLAVFKGGPVLFGSLSAAIGSVCKGELVLNSVGYFIHGNKIVVVAELVGGWEESVLLALEWHIGIGQSGLKLLGLNLVTVLNFFDFVENRGFGLLHEVQEDYVVLVLLFLECFDVQLHLSDKLLDCADILIRQRVLAHHSNSGDQSLAVCLDSCNLLNAFRILEGDSFLEHLDRPAKVINELFTLLLRILHGR